MPQYLIYIIAVALVLLIVIIGFAYSRKVTAKYRNAAQPDTAGQSSDAPTAPKNSGIYEKPGIDQQSDHSLGAVQDVIRGRIRFLVFGLVLLGVSLYGLYALLIAQIDLGELSKTPLYRLITTVILAGAVVYALRLISFITYRIRLRRTGFEISSILGTRAYQYIDVDFRLFDQWESRFAGDGYRPVVIKTESHNRVWVWQVIFKDGRKTIEIKSSRYAWLMDKTRGLTDGFATFHVFVIFFFILSNC